MVGQRLCEQLCQSAQNDFANLTLLFALYPPNARWKLKMKRCVFRLKYFGCETEKKEEMKQKRNRNNAETEAERPIVCIILFFSPFANGEDQKDKINAQ